MAQDRNRDRDYEKKDHDPRRDDNFNADRDLDKWIITDRVPVPDKDDKSKD